MIISIGQLMVLCWSTLYKHDHFASKVEGPLNNCIKSETFVCESPFFFRSEKNRNLYSKTKKGAESFSC